MNDWQLDCLHWYGEPDLLQGTFRHWCPDWDDLPIDETCGEFLNCTCYTGIPAADAIYARLNAEFDAYNAAHPPIAEEF